MKQNYIIAVTGITCLIDQTSTWVLTGRARDTRRLVSSGSINTSQDTLMRHRKRKLWEFSEIKQKRLSKNVILSRAQTWRA